MKYLATITIVLLISFPSFSQVSKTQNDFILEDKKPNFFLAYELGEMAFNRFQNFAGEAGLKFNNRHMLRLVYMNVKLTEGHLSSNFAKAVDGNNVEGLWKGFEVFYDIPIFNRFNAGGSIGYYDNFYQHTLLDESVGHKSWSAGFDLNYREMDIFRVKGLYFNFTLPFRFYFNPLEETNLGDSRVIRHAWDNNIWFFIGYEF